MADMPKKKKKEVAKNPPQNATQASQEAESNARDIDEQVDTLSFIQARNEATGGTGTIAGEDKIPTVQEVLSEKIGVEEIRKASQILQKYKTGKANLEKRIVENEQWLSCQTKQGSNRCPCIPDIGIRQRNGSRNVRRIVIDSNLLFQEILLLFIISRAQLSPQRIEGTFQKRMRSPEDTCILPAFKTMEHILHLL